MTAPGEPRAPGLRPLRLSFGNTPPLDVPAPFMALGGVSMVAGCVLIAIWAEQLVTPGGWATPQALALTHILALGFATSVMAGVLYQMLPVILGARPASARGARLVWWRFLASTAIFTGTLVSGRDDLAPIGGIALTVAILGISAHAGAVMRRATRWNVVALYLVVALGCLDAIAVIHPEQRAGTLSTASATRLHHAVRTVISRAVEDGGTRFEDYANARLFRRQTKPCLVCGTRIQRTHVAGRGHEPRSPLPAVAPTDDHLGAMSSLAA